MLDHKNTIKYLEIYSNKPPLAGSDEGAFLPAVCHVQLNNYVEAKGLFEKSIFAMFNPRAFWKSSGQVDWLVTICILSGRDDLCADVRQQLDAYGSLKKDNFYFYFSNAVMELLLPFDADITQQIQRLLLKPKYKDMYASGLTLQAIQEPIY